LIQNAIKDNKNGTYTVTFPGDPDNPITVNAPTIAQLGVFNQATKNGTWAAVMEEAFGAYLDKQSLISEFTSWLGDAPPEQGAGSGGLLGPALDLLTGTKSTTTDVTKASEQTIAAQLTAAFSTNPAKSVTIGTPATKTGETVDGFPNSHAITVVGFDPSGPDGGTVTLRDPWGFANGPMFGGPNGTPLGRDKISLDQVMKNFNTLAIAG
jgi:hypothetical protein